jgi:hypothetical protein
MPYETEICRMLNTKKNTNQVKFYLVEVKLIILLSNREYPTV